MGVRPARRTPTHLRTIAARTTHAAARPPGASTSARRMTRSAGPNLLSAAWTGALLVCAADLVTQRVTGSALMPVGVVTGVAGGAYLAWLLHGERRAGKV